MKKFALLLGLLPAIAFAQSSPNWPTGYNPTTAEINAVFAGKQDVGAANFTGTFNGPVGNVTPSTGSFTTLNTSGLYTLSAGSTLTWNNVNWTWAGTAASGQTLVNALGTWGGTTGNIGGPAPLGISLNLFDNINASATGGTTAINANIHSDPLQKGGFAGIIGQALIDTTSANSTSAPYEGGQFNVVASVSDNGTGPAPLGHLAAILTSAKLTGSATNYSALYGAEFSTQALGGTSVQHKHGVVNVLLTSDAARGSGLDAAELITSQYQQGATAPWKYGMVFGGWPDSNELFFPVGKDGTVIAAVAGAGDSSIQVTNLIDFSAISTVSGHDILMPGFSVDGSGNLQASQIFAQSPTNANSFNLAGASASSSPTASVTGSDTNISMTFLTKGAGAYLFDGNGGVALDIVPVASGVSYPKLTNASAGNILIDVGGTAAGITIGGSTATSVTLGASAIPTTVSGALTVKTVATSTNCTSGASPAVCGAAVAGGAAVPTGTNPTLVVQTTAVTATSVILLTPDESLGTKLSVTCNTTVTTQGPLIVTARSAGTSFTVQVDATVGTNPVCFNWMLIN